MTDEQVQRKNSAIKMALLLLLGILAGMLLRGNIGFLRNPIIHIGTVSGPLTNNSRSTDETLFFDYRINMQYKTIQSIKLVFLSGNGQIKRAWEGNYESKNLVTDTVDLDSDGLKEILLLCPPKVIFLDDKYTFITRDQDLINMYGNWKIHETKQDGVYLKREASKGDKKGAISVFYKWNRANGFTEIQSPARVSS